MEGVVARIYGHVGTIEGQVEIAMHCIVAGGDVERAACQAYIARCLDAIVAGGDVERTSAYEDKPPSSPASMDNAPPAIFTQSLPRSPSLAALIW